MQLCYFMPSKHLISNLENRRLKISSFDQCNDVFELGNFRAPEQTDKETKKKIRKEIRTWSKDANKNMGLICFTSRHYSPLMWAHYADQNRGACLVFEYKEEDGAKLVKVDYTRNRHIHPLGDALPKLSINTPSEDLIKYCATKELDWSYEEEQRLLIFFDEAKSIVKIESELKFLEWGSSLKLKKVYLGAKPDCCVKSIRKVLAKEDNDVIVEQKRAAFRDFRIVTQGDKTHWKKCKNSEYCSCPQFNPS